jgi:hypothetical protein
LKNETVKEKISLLITLKPGNIYGIGVKLKIIKNLKLKNKKINLKKVWNI